MSFHDSWAKAQVSDGQGGDGNRAAPDEGKFVVEVIDAAAFTSKAGDDYLKIELRVTSSEHTGYEWTELRNFKSQGAATAAKTTCAKLGIPVEQVSDFEQLDVEMKAVIGYSYAVTAARNGEYLNTYIDERVGGSDIPSDVPRGVPAGAVADDDDIPF
jgi:hypothetical protein